MSVLTTGQATDAAAASANHFFGNFVRSLGGGAKATATVNLADLLVAVQALDNALDTTLNAAVTAGFGAQTIINALAAQLVAPVSGLTAQQKTIILVYTLMKRVGLV